MAPRGDAAAPPAGPHYPPLITSTARMHPDAGANDTRHEYSTPHETMASPVRAGAAGPVADQRPGQRTRLNTRSEPSAPSSSLPRPIMATDRSTWGAPTIRGLIHWQNQTPTSRIAAIRTACRCSRCSSAWWITTPYSNAAIRCSGRRTHWTTRGWRNSCVESAARDGYVRPAITLSFLAR